MGRTTWLATGAGLIAIAVAVTSRVRFKNSGATQDESVRRLPGDELIFDAASITTRAITIHAPPKQVWRWLIQIGQDRGGWYSYLYLENVLGLDIHNTDQIRAEWQHLAVGDEVRVAPPGALGMKDGYAFRVAQVDPPHALVLRQQPPEHPWNATWAFVLVPDGEDSCRLITRSRAAKEPGPAGRAAWLAGELMDPITLLMTQKMLRGIRDRAEAEHTTALRHPAEP